MPHDTLHADLYDEYMEESIGLTVLDCIAKSWHDAAHGFKPCEVLETYHKSITSPELSYYERAKESIDYWRHYFMVRRMQGADISSSWQKGMIELVTNTDDFVKRKQLKLIVTIPKYTELQQRWENYELLYKSCVNVNHGQKTGVRLELIDRYTNSTRNKREHNVFVFKDLYTNELYTYETVRNSGEKVFLDAILSFKNNLVDCEVWTTTKSFSKNFNYNRITVFDHIV